MAVRSTITQTDLLEKRRLLNEEIVRIKQVKEPLEREIRELNQSISTAYDSKRELEEAISKTLSLSDELANEANQRASEYAKVVESFILLLESFRKAVNNAETKVQEKKKEFELLCITIEQETKRIGEESAKLTRWSNDIDVYRTRIEKMIKEQSDNVKGMKDVKIILT